MRTNLCIKEETHSIRNAFFSERERERGLLWSHLKTEGLWRVSSCLLFLHRRYHDYKKKWGRRNKVCDHRQDHCPYIVYNVSPLDDGRRARINSRSQQIWRHISLNQRDWIHCHEGRHVVSNGLRRCSSKWSSCRKIKTFISDAAGKRRMSF